MSVAIIGVSTTKFGELWGTSPRALAREAVFGAMKDARIAPKEIQALFVGNMLSGILGGQEHLGAFFSEELGLRVPAFRIEGACASGGLALHSAVGSILSGQHETVVVLGIEKMTDHKPEDVAAALMAAGSQEERSSGATFPGLYAFLARAHMEAFGTTVQDLAVVAVKNHFHASLNTNAQFRNTITKEQVLASSKIADPLRLLDCSPVSDGAAALIITSNRRQATGNRRSVTIAASAVATDTLGLAQRESLLELKATKKSSKEAYRQAGVDPGDIDVAEVHDCFTIAEILAIEDLGFAGKGKAAAELERGEYTLNKAKKLVVNPSGGLKGCGHPVGATGVKQVVELVEQLRMDAGDRQVIGVRVGLAHNVGGSGATAVVHILKRA
ncbi:thiolase domain-containing protein [Patescibacteria group bacterium]|nr:thiolase domain-containing protein [Patescibacteria group bacterium]MBU1472197.1 thiolase domain-containing protein [Patescibacteria group bacterium]MBU2459591.1 thiolase domain-containing protein [Patescibacteria group bacterium]MBU2544168.1 thiolase domain-containing protein [Patescibacteria group bacterium]